ncbi:MAG: hypothetical protein ACJASL_000976 [Paraglaciecola sp.]
MQKEEGGLSLGKNLKIDVEDCYKTCEQIKGLGGNIVREAGPLAGSDEVIALLKTLTATKLN